MKAKATANDKTEALRMIEEEAIKSFEEENEFSEPNTMKEVTKDENEAVEIMSKQNEIEESPKEDTLVEA